MTEGGIYDPALAALAIKQASGDLVEAIFLLRAYRTTLPRLAQSTPLATGSMRIERRISAVYKDLPGGQVLGPTYDYSHRLLDFTLIANGETPPPPRSEQALPEHCPHMFSMMSEEGFAEAEHDDGSEPTDITREPMGFPASRAARLQQLVRGDEGFLLSLGYSTQRGYGRTHPFAGEIRTGYVSVSICPEELGFELEIGGNAADRMRNGQRFYARRRKRPALYAGLWLVFGRAERKAMSMALVDRALQTREHHERITSPAQDEEFVLSHADNVEAAGLCPT